MTLCLLTHHARSRSRNARGDEGGVVHRMILGMIGSAGARAGVVDPRCTRHHTTAPSRASSRARPCHFLHGKSLMHHTPHHCAIARTIRIISRSTSPHPHPSRGPSWPRRRAVGRCHGGDTAVRNAALGCARPTTGPSISAAAGRCSFFVYLHREAARDGRGGGTRRLLARCRGLPCPSGPSAAGRCWCRAPGWAGARSTVESVVGAPRPRVAQ